MKSLVLALLFTLAAICQAEVISGRVIGVIDGDTIDVLGDSKTTYRIRLAGIDAPERKQAFGTRSKQSLSDLVYQKRVDIETHKKDRYGRRVGKVLIEGKDVNLEQLHLGMAWFYREYERELNPQDRKLYDLAETQARKMKLGLWVDENAVSPWKFR